MSNNLWFIAALSAAVLWGVAYAISEKLLKSSISPAFLMLSIELITLPVLLAIVFKMGNAKEQIALFASSPFLTFLCVLMALAIVAGNLLIFFSVTEKNATMTSLIEISYPLFVFIFSWIFFKEIQINWQQAIGGVLIFTGIGIVFLKS